MRAAIERAQRFLGLTALLAAILAGVAVALGTRRFVERHLDGCAVMRCLGATQAQLLRLYGLEFLLLGAGAPARVGLRHRLRRAGGDRRRALAEVLRADLPAPRLLPAVQGFLVGLVLLLGFALPPLVQLKNVPAVRVIRRESGGAKGGTLAAYAAGLAALSALLIWQAGDLKLGVYRGRRLRARRWLVFFVVAWVAAAIADPAVRSSRWSRNEHAALRPRQPAAPRARQRGAGREPRARPHRGAAAHLHAQRPGRRLAAQRAARCAQPLPDRRAARPARAAAGVLRRAQDRRCRTSTRWCAAA